MRAFAAGMVKLSAAKSPTSLTQRLSAIQTIDAFQQTKRFVDIRDMHRHVHGRCKFYRSQMQMSQVKASAGPSLRGHAMTSIH